MKQVEYSKPLFICTQTPGDVYYRMGVFSQNMGGELFPKQSLYMMPNWEEVLEKESQIMYDIEDAVKRSNIVIWQRLSTKRGLATMMGIQWKYRNIKMLVEIDDDAFNVDSSNPGFMILKPDKEAHSVFSHQLKIADGIIVSTEHLKHQFKKFNKNIFVVPNAIDFKMWSKVKKVPHKGLVIGWQGGMQHGRDLEILMPVVPKILKKYNNVEFHFFGAMPQSLKNIERCKYHAPVPILDYPRTMGKINPDILVAPLYDNYMNRGRSNLRALEAGALKTPLIASAGNKLPYGILEDCDGGYLVKNTEEWIKCLESLIEDKAERVQKGVNLYREVFDNYNIVNGAKAYKAILNKF